MNQGISLRRRPPVANCINCRAAYHNTTRSCFMARRTQTIITETFIDLLTQKPLDKITVKDIIEKADINRNTFYYYYENKKCDICRFNVGRSKRFCC